MPLMDKLFGSTFKATEGTRKYKVFKWSILACFLLSVFGVSKNVDLIGLASLIGLIGGIPSMIFGWGNVQEWRAKTSGGGADG